MRLLEYKQRSLPSSLVAGVWRVWEVWEEPRLLLLLCEELPSHEAGYCEDIQWEQPRPWAQLPRCLYNSWDCILAQLEQLVLEVLWEQL